MAPSHHLLTVDGRRLSMRSLGEGGPTVVMISGGGTPSILSWPLQDRLAAHSRVVSYDRPGLGWSDAGETPQDFDAHARDLAALLAAAGEAPPYVLLAESYGGLVARAFTRLYPDKVAGLALIDAAEETHVFAHLDQLRAKPAQLRLYGLLARLGLLGWLARHRPAVFSAHHLTADQRAELGKIVSRPAFVRSLPLEVAAYDLTPPERRVAGGFGALGDLPLTVIRHGRPFEGAQRALESGWAEAQARLAALSTNSRMIVAETSGHAIAQTSPELVADAIVELLSRIRSKP